MNFKGLEIPPGRENYDDANLSWVYTDVHGLVLTSPESADTLLDRMVLAIQHGEEWYKLVAWSMVPNTSPPLRRTSILTLRTNHLVGVGE